MSGAEREAFESARLGGALIVARPNALAWIEDALREHGSLYTAARVSAVRTLSGRGVVPVMEDPTGPGPPWVVRHYRRGGGMRFLNDRFLRHGIPRSIRELEASEAVREAGITTPRTVAATVHTSGPFYRADLITELVPDARDLADVLLGDPRTSLEAGDPSDRVAALTCAAALIRRMASVGVDHPDLNAKNILVTRSSQGMEAVLVDLDRCSVRGGGARVDGGRLRRRLLRSIRKLARTRSARLNENELKALMPEAEPS